MTKFAPACTAFCSTSSVAIDVVTTPVTTVDGSPVLNVSTSSLLQSTPMFFLMRSTISCAVTVRAQARSHSTKGLASAPAAAARRSRVVKWMSSRSQTYHFGRGFMRPLGLCGRFSLSRCDRAHGRLTAPAVFGGLAARRDDDTTTTTKPSRSLRRILTVGSTALRAVAGVRDWADHKLSQRSDRQLVIRPVPHSCRRP